jgi:hypothetical protein
MNMSVQPWQQAVIEFVTTESVPSICIYWQMKVIYGEEYVDISTVYMELQMLMMESLNRSPDTE